MILSHTRSDIIGHIRCSLYILILLSYLFKAIFIICNKKHYSIIMAINIFNFIFYSIRLCINTSIVDDRVKYILFISNICFITLTYKINITNNLYKNKSFRLLFICYISSIINCYKIYHINNISIYIVVTSLLLIKLIFCISYILINYKISIIQTHRLFIYVTYIINTCYYISITVLYMIITLTIYNEPNNYNKIICIMLLSDRINKNLY